MTSQIRLERKEYYAILEYSQKQTIDITDWLEWFLNCLLEALYSSDTIIKKVVIKHDFWNRNVQISFNERQKFILNKLLDNFYGNPTSTKYAKLTKCSKDTALRDIQDLIQKQILQKTEAGGRSTNYELVSFDS